MQRKILKREEKIDLTSMIDVTFLLLIFFMLLPFKTNEGKLDTYMPTDLGFLQDRPPKEEDLEDIRVFFRSVNKGKTVSVALDNRWLKQEIETDMISEEETAKNKQVIRKQIDEVYSAFDLVDKALEEKNRERPVTIDSDREVPYVFIVLAQASLKKAGFEKVRFSAPKRRLKEDEWK